MAAASIPTAGYFDFNPVSTDRSHQPEDRRYQAAAQTAIDDPFNEMLPRDLHQQLAELHCGIMPPSASGNPFSSGNSRVVSYRLHALVRHRDQNMVRSTPHEPFN